MAVLQNRDTVAVILVTFNHGHFLADAITSVLEQTRQADEIIVVDDGSTDDPAAVVANFPSVRFIQQSNRGPSAARNAGLQSCTTRYVVFLDADDRLLPIALQTGLDFARTHPDCAFVYGRYRVISKCGDAAGSSVFDPINGDAHVAFLRRNPIGALSCVLFRRDCLLAVNGFDESTRLGEDADLYLRITQNFAVANHPEIIAEYRRHGQNASSNLIKMYLDGDTVLARHKTRIASDRKALAVLVERQAKRRSEYAALLVLQAGALWRTEKALVKILKNLVYAAQLSPIVTTHTLVSALCRRAIKLVDRRLCPKLPDRASIRLRFTMYHGYIPSLKNPKTFSEWVNSKKLADRNPLLSMTADKLAARNYVKERCGEGILVPLLQVADRAEHVNFKQLPNKFVLKASHASGAIEIVRNKLQINENELRAKMGRWLKMNYYEVHRERHYKNIPPRIIAEEALLDNENQPPNDYKFYVFHGVVQMIHVDVGRFLEHRRSLFDREWKLLNASLQYPSAGQLPKPPMLEEMIAVAETLGREFSFVRIDLYEYQRRVFFGEITHTPGAGFEPFIPLDFDRVLGEVFASGLAIPECYRIAH